MRKQIKLEVNSENICLGRMPFCKIHLEQYWIFNIYFILIVVHVRIGSKLIDKFWTFKLFIVFHNLFMSNLSALSSVGEDHSVLYSFPSWANRSIR